MQVLIDPEELAAELKRETPPRLLDVRWSLGGPAGRPEYEAGHVPGAVFVDLERDLAAPAEPLAGRHPLPTIEAFTASARGWGLDDGDAVVVYDDSSGMAAARAWWLLRHAGVASVRILDGGLAAWREAGLPTERGQAQVPAGTVSLAFGGMPVIGIEDAAGYASAGLLLDARAGERYRGEVEPVDPRAGHVPGAVSAPTAQNLDENGRFLPVERLRARFEELGAAPGRPVAAYCGSGVTAAHEVAALAVAGIDAALYPGSYSQWSNHPELPVATGPNPG